MQPQLYDTVSAACSKQVTRHYSTSFTLGINLLGKKLHDPIYSIYGFVRLADEIVDTFHAHQPAMLMVDFREATEEAIRTKFSLNPILHAFQSVVHQYYIDAETIELFMQSMDSDLHAQVHDRHSYDRYILGSAEVVGLMCLRVFTDGNQKQYEVLKPFAMRLGSAFQKVNFLRDIKADYEQLGRVYFPGVSFSSFSDEAKHKIECEIKDDFEIAVRGIRMLPPAARLGVYTAYLYYRSLFAKIRATPARAILNQRIRISNRRKLLLLCAGMVRNNLGQL